MHSTWIQDTQCTEVCLYTISLHTYIRLLYGTRVLWLFIVIFFFGPDIIFVVASSACCLYDDVYVCCKCSQLL